MVGAEGVEPSGQLVPNQIYSLAPPPTGLGSQVVVPAGFEPATSASSGQRLCHELGYGTFELGGAARIRTENLRCLRPPPLPRLGYGAL